MTILAKKCHKKDILLPYLPSRIRIQFSDVVSGKIRYLAGWCVSKIRTKYSKLVKSPVPEARRSADVKLKLMDTLREP